jgi:hypothetical protein
MADGRGLGYSQIVMQRPPQMPSILSTRQAYQWIHRIARKHQQFHEQQLSQTIAQAVACRVEAEFVTSLLRLAGETISPDEVIKAVTGEAKTEPSNRSAIGDSLKAYRLLKALIQEQKQNARLTVDLLGSLNAAIATGALRRTPVAGSGVHPDSLPVILENACRWFSSGSISELNPVEQAALAFLRFIEIAPFERQNEPTALLAASLLTMRQDLPPIILKSHHLADYREAIHESSQMNTQPMVELVAGSVEHSLDEMIESAKQAK